MEIETPKWGKNGNKKIVTWRQKYLRTQKEPYRQSLNRRLQKMGKRISGIEDKIEVNTLIKEYVNH